MSVLASIAVAFSMYSRIPAPRVAWDERTMRYALAAFPLVGIVQGGVCAAWGFLAAWVGLEPLIVAAVLVALPIAVNGGIHLDGLCDTADALASHADRARKLEILKDPHIGAFGAIALGVYLMLLFALFASFPLERASLLCLPFAFALSRALSGLAVVLWPKARPEGTVGTFARNARSTASAAVLCLWAALLSAALAVVGAGPGAAAAVCAFLAFGAYRIMAMRAFGGVTGDVAGWFLQVAELAMIAALTIGGMAL